MASRVLPVPPGPVRVSSRVSGLVSSETTCGEFVLAAEEGGGGDGKGEPVERPERWVLCGSELVDAFGCVEVFEAVVAEVLQLHVTVEQLGGVAGEDDLAAVRGAHDAGGAVDVDPEVVGRIQRRLAGVDPDPDPDRAAVQSVHRLADRHDGLLGALERVEERVALGVDLVAGVAGARLAHDPPVLGQSVPVALYAELLQ